MDHIGNRIRDLPDLQRSASTNCATAYLEMRPSAVVCSGRTMAHDTVSLSQGALSCFAAWLYSDVNFRRLPALQLTRNPIDQLFNWTQLPATLCLRSVEQVRPQRSASTLKSPPSKVAESCALMVYYGASSVYFLPMFQGDLSVPF